MVPLARADGVLVRELAGEAVVYDLHRNQAHCLNLTAAVVFRHCDGRRSVEEIAAQLHDELGLPADASLVRMALERLDQARLLEWSPVEPPEPSRREVVRRLGLGLSVLLPAVTSILVPAPAEAAVTCVVATSCAGNPGSACYVSSSFACDGSCTCQVGTCSGNCCDSLGGVCSF
jgi:hypothetical protein